jgi:quercetin dioxygenase-like cupin family protein
MDDFAKRVLSDLNLDEIAPHAKKQSLVDHWSPAVLLERAAYLRKMAKYGDGSASEVIKEYPHYAAVLSFLSRTSDAEVHHGYTILFHVLAGAATLVTGGTVARPRPTGAGELRGASIENGSSQELRQGDIAHVPAGVAHQFLIAGDKSITCLIVKIQEVK